MAAAGKSGTAPTARRSAAWLAAALAIVTSVSGCGGIALTPSRAAPPSTVSAPAPTTSVDDQSSTAVPSAGPTGGTSPGSGKVPVGQIQQDLSSAEEVVDGYWKTHWSDFFTGSYSSPKIFGLYDASNGPPCGGEPADPDNAFYCSDGDFLAFGEPLLSDGYAGGTNSFTYLVVAHEWGHAIQNRLTKELNSQAAELQADCFAGAVLYGAAKDGTLQFEQGDEKSIVSSLTNLADNTAWTMTSDHGDAFQRIESFDQGRQGGVQACLPKQ